MKAAYQAKYGAAILVFGMLAAFVPSGVEAAQEPSDAK
jgi:hypothetical protein